MRLLGGRYRLVSVLGRGGMGTVWRARDDVLARDVAVKEVLVPPGLSDDERAVLHERTLREARATARLNHPAIVTVHDVVDEDDRPWIVMALLRARSLQDIIDEDGPQPPRRVAEIGRQMLGALRTAHGAGILHRDVKPGNVLITEDGRAVLTDFGIAYTAGDTTLTQGGLIMGSPAYIAPERAQGLRAGPAADLWALGAALYTACEGRPPHHRPDAMSVLAAILTEDPPPPRNAGPLQPILWGLLDRDPARRMRADVAADLLAQVAAGGTPPRDAETTPPLTTPAHYEAPPQAPRRDAAAAPRRRGRGTVLVAAGALTVLLVAAAAFLTLHPLRDSASPPTTPSTTPSVSVVPPRPSPAATLPPGWVSATGPGYTVGVPAGWTRWTNRQSVFWRDPGSAAYLQADRTDWTGEPYPAWQKWEVDVRVNQSLKNYRRLDLRRAIGTPYDAADIEFTWDGKDGIRMRGVDRRIIVAGRRYTIFVAIPETRWSTSQGLVTGFFGAFVPTR
jgi:serine/threonine protein kinase